VRHIPGDHGVNALNFGHIFVKKSWRLCKQFCLKILFENGYVCRIVSCWLNFALYVYEGTSNGNIFLELFLGVSHLQLWKVYSLPKMECFREKIRKIKICFIL
jgi:hypothetical protein